MPESLPMYNRAVESQHTSSYKSSIRTASVSSSSGPAHQRTGVPSWSATERKFSSGQRLDGLLANGCMTVRFSRCNAGTGIFGIPSGDGGWAGKKRERKMADGLAELGPVRSVPREDRIEIF
jgi:hypothetical protein